MAGQESQKTGASSSSETTPEPPNVKVGNMKAEGWKIPQARRRRKAISAVRLPARSALVAGSGIGVTSAKLRP